MGVPKLFNVITKNNVTYSAIVENIDKEVSVKYFYLDFNSIVHVVSQILVIELNEILYILMSLKSKSDLQNNKTIKKIYDKYSPHLDNFYKKFNHFESEEIICNKFNEYMDVDKLVINLVTDQIHYLIKTFIKGTIDLLYIAIDGVPSKSKMVEQKQRRYMGAIVSEYKKFLFKKYEDVLKKSKTVHGSSRYLYEQHKIEFNKSKISPGTTFMDDLTNKLGKESFDCKKYILSSIDEIGEGEKKIIDHIKDNKYSDCMIYSPDADMILLTSLLEEKGHVILRHNQQTSTKDETIYDLIRIDIFKNNMYDYLDNKSVNKKNFIKDMICLASVFGNDFIPKIESIDVQYNFEQLLGIYLDTFKFFDEKNYLTEYNKDKKKYYLDVNFFVKFLENYWDAELFNMKENYMLNNFKMYKMFKSIYSKNSANVNGDPNYINHTNFEEMNMMFQERDMKLADIIKSLPSFDKNRQLEMVNEQLNKIFSSPTSSNSLKIKKEDFINYLKELVNFGLFQNDIPHDIKKDYQSVKKYVSSLDDQKFLKLFIGVQLKEKRLVRTYRDDLYKNSSKISRHRNTINEMIKRGESTPYDKEYYIFSNMLDHYSDMLKNEPLNLVNLDDSPKQTIGAYYKLFFDVDDYTFVENKNKIKKDVQGEKLQTGIKQYLEGLVWTFNYYYNETNNVSKWFYDGERAPTLRDIYIYIHNNPNCLREAYNNLKIYEVKSLNNFFNPIEQLMYITPRTEENKELIPKKYLHFFETNSYYLNINHIVQNLSKEIDCTGARYLNKCLIKSLKRYDMTYDEQFLKMLRSIKK